MTKTAAIIPTGAPRTEQAHATAPWHDPDWRTLWLATQEQDRPWRSLALVPAGPGLSNESIVQVAATLSHTGTMHSGGSVHVADGTRVGLAEMAEFAEMIRRCTERESDRVVIALASLMESVTSLAIAQAADCAMLCVLRGEMRTAHMKRTIDEVGNEHFLGSAMFRRPDQP